MQKIIEHFFNISHDASASVIITLLTFFLGYLVTGIVFLISRYLTRRSNRKIFIDNLTSLNKSLKRQEKGFLNAIKSFDIVKNTPWTYDKTDFFQLAVFKEMSYKDTLKCFFTGIENQSLFSQRKAKRLKRRAFNKTWENLNTIEFWSAKAFADFYPILEKYNKFGDCRNDAVKKLRQMWEHLMSVTTQNSPPLHIEYIKKLDNIVAAFQKIPTEERVGPYTVQRNLVLKIKILNKKYPQLPFIRAFNDVAMDASTYYHEMELLIRHTKYQYKIYYYTIRTIRKTNDKIIKILNQSLYSRIVFCKNKLSKRISSFFRKK